MTSNGFGQSQQTYTVSITWKHGFTHSYEQKLNDKQIASEQQRITSMRWVDSVNFDLVKK